MNITATKREAQGKNSLGFERSIVVPAVSFSATALLFELPSCFQLISCILHLTSGSQRDIGIRWNRSRMAVRADDQPFGDRCADAAGVIDEFDARHPFGGRPSDAVGFDAQRMLQAPEFENQFTGLFTGRADVPALLTTKHAEEPFKRRNRVAQAGAGKRAL